MRTQIDADIEKMDVRQEGTLVTLDIPDRLEGGNGVMLDMDKKDLNIFWLKLCEFFSQEEGKK